MPWKMDVSDETSIAKTIRGKSSEWDDISVLVIDSGVNSAPLL